MELVTPGSSLSYASGKFTITAKTVSGSISASSNVSWARVSVSGNTISVTYDENLTGSSRNGRISVSVGSLTKYFDFSQAAHTLAVTPQTITLDATGSAKNLSISASCKYGVTPNASWLTVTSNGNGVAISAPKNTNKEAREATLTVSGGGVSRTVTVKQEGNSIALSKTSASWGYQAGSDEFTAKAVVGTIAVTSNVSWASVSQNGNTITVKYSENRTGSTRNGRIALSVGNITSYFDFSQVALELNVSPGTIELEANGSAKNVSVSANCKYGATPNANWVTVTSNGNGYAISASPNNNKEARSTTVIINGDGLKRTVTVKQKGNTLSLSSPASSKNYAAGSFTLTASTSVGTVKAESSVTWATVSQNGNTITVKYGENLTGETRYGRVTATIGNLTATYSFSQSPHTLTLSANTIALDATGSAKNLSVSASAQYGATVHSNWVTIKSNGNGYAISALPNLNKADRTTTVSIIAGGVKKNVTVTQKGNTLSLSGTDKTKGQIAGTFVLTATTSTGNVTAKTDDNWITLSQSGNRITVKYTENVTGKVRTGKIYVSVGDITQVYEFTQNAHDFTITPSSIQLDATGSAKNLSVKASCRYGLAPGANWITAVQNGNGYAISASPNLNRGERTGTVVISGGGASVSVVVKQSGNTLSLGNPRTDLAYSAGIVNISARTLTGTVKASSEVSWAKVSQKGNDITVLYEENLTGKERSGKVKVVVGDITEYYSFKQAAHSLTVSPGTIVFDATGSAKNLGVTATCNYGIRPEANWITAKSNGNGYAITALPNINGKERTANIVLTGGGKSVSVTVRQTGNTLSLDGASKTVTYAAGKVSFSAKTLTGNVKATTNASWLKVSQSGNAITVNYEENLSGKIRDGIITVTIGDLSATYKITQAAHILTLATDTITLDATGSAKNLSVTASCVYGAAPGANWITTKSNGNGLAISALPNSSGKDRSATLVISGGGKSCTVTVKQTGNQLSVEKRALYIEAYGTTTLKVSVKALVGTVSIARTPNWVTAEMVGNEMRVSVKPNLTGKYRSNSIDLKVGDIESSIYVGQKPYELSVPSGKNTITAKGGTITVPVQTNYTDFACTPQEPWGWVRVLQKRSDAVVLTIEPNYTAESREFRLKVLAAGLEQNVTVVQDANKLVLSQKTVTLYPESLQRTITVATNAGVPTLKVSENWLTASISDDGTITITPQENKSKESRTATITVTLGSMKDTLTVVQKPYVLSLSENRWEVEAGAHEKVFICECSSAEGFSVSSDQHWLGVYKAPGGISVWTQSNTSKLYRVGVITVESKGLIEKLVVYQKGNHLTLSKTKCDVGPEECTEYFVVDAPAGKIAMKIDVPWVTLFLNEKTVTVGISENCTGSQRTATVEVTAADMKAEYKITQKPYEMTVDTPMINTDALERRVTVVVTSTSPERVSIASSEPWLDATWIGEDKYEIYIAGNSTMCNRGATITFTQPRSGTKQIVGVVQDANKLESISLMRIKVRGGSYSVEVSATTGALSAKTSDSWLKVSVDRDNKVVNFTADRNNSRKERIGYIYVSAGVAEKKIKIIQPHSLVDVALSQLQVDNTSRYGGRKYQIYLGKDSNVAWCACFVAWCANECGYIDDGIMPNSAGCIQCINWYKDKDEWLPGHPEPRPGMVIFFDWDGDKKADHTGIVTGVSGGKVYTVEGNRGNAVGSFSYDLDNSYIFGYGVPDGVIETITVTYDVNGGEGQENLGQETKYVGCEYGHLPAAPGAPMNYEFDGWYTDPLEGEKIESSSIVGSDDITLYAHWVGIYKVNISFDINGGEAGQQQYLQSITRRNGDLYGKLPTGLVKKDYVFAGWYTDRLNGTRVTPEMRVDRLKDYTLYAHWLPDIEVKISFNVNGGVAEQQQFLQARSVRVGSEYGKLPSGVVRVGWEFLGWFTDAKKGVQITEQTIVETLHDHILYAHWAKTVNVFFDTNGGEGQQFMPTLTVLVGQKYSDLPIAPSRNGYEFLGWFTEKKGGYRVFEDSTVVIEESHTLYAHWGLIQPVTVSFDVNGGDPLQQQFLNTITVTAYKPYGNLPKNVVRSGYTFSGWYTEKEGGELVTDNSIVTIASNHTLYAHWISTLQMTVTLDLNYGKGSQGNYKQITVTFGEKYENLPKDPSREGYVFGGWGLKKAGGVIIDSKSTVTETKDHVLYAHWYIKKTDYSDAKFSYPVENGLMLELDYNLNFLDFFKSSYGLNHDLMLASLKTAMAAFDKNNASLSERGANIKKLMSDLGFLDISCHYPEPKYDTMGFAIGRRDIYDEKTKERATLILVAVRGAGYGDEWGGNFHVYNPNGSNLNHWGFDIAATTVLDDSEGLVSYIKNHKDKFEDTVKIWVVGYSRAAATTNLVCSKIIRRSINDSFPVHIESTDVFGFGFETPRCTTDSDCYDERYNGIKSLINPIDFVPMVAMNNGKQWNYKRYGITYEIPSGDSDAKAQMMNVYYNILSKYYADPNKELKSRTNEYTSYTLDKKGRSQHKFLSDVFTGLANETISPKLYYEKGVQAVLPSLMATVMNLFDGEDCIPDVKTLTQNFIMNNVQFLHMSTLDKVVTSTYVARILSDVGIVELAAAVGIVIRYAHYPELCLSWLTSCPTFTGYRN